jgi:hypothetical protein
MSLRRLGNIEVDPGISEETRSEGRKGQRIRQRVNRAVPASISDQDHMEANATFPLRHQQSSLI